MGEKGEGTQSGLDPVPLYFFANLRLCFLTRIDFPITGGVAQW